MDGTNRLTMYESCILHARADRSLRSVIAKQLESFGITMTEWLLLGVASSSPKDGYSMSKIASILDVTMPQVTALVNALMHHGLVRQKTQSNDRRSRHVLVTVKGQNTLHKVESKIDQTMRLWLADIPKTQLRIYLDIVHKLATHKLPL